MSARRVDADVLVLGGGMAGAMAALSARAGGARVALVRRAPGATALSSGAVGVAPDLGAGLDEPLAWRRGPVEAARRLAALRPEHPYALVGADLARLPEALSFAARALDPLLSPALDRPRFLATPLGTAAGAALCQRSMAAGDLLTARGPLAVAGFRGHLGFDAALVASGLARFVARGGPETLAVEVELPFDDPAARPHELARALDAPGAAEALGDRLRAALAGRGAGAALLPPVLGLAPGGGTVERVAAAAGLPVAETLSDVPSVPGLRLQAALDAALRTAGVEVITGSVRGAPVPGDPLEADGVVLAAGWWILATGRFLGGGIARRGALIEPALALPVQAAEGREAGVHLAQRPAVSLTVRDRRAPQPLLSAGLRVDPLLRPVDDLDRPVHPRLLAAGAVVGGHEHATDGTGLGVAILTGYLAGRNAAAGVRA